MPKETATILKKEYLRLIALPEQSQLHALKFFLNREFNKTSDIPTIDEVRIEIEINDYSIEAENFWHHYNANGWVTSSGRKIKNWKSCLVTWQHSPYNKKKTPSKSCLKDWYQEEQLKEVFCG